MEADFLPSRDAFSRTFESGNTQIVYQRIVNDLDTPVSAYLKLALGKPYAFLFESVQGGEQRGRYSFLGFSPDIVWRATNGQAEIAHGIETVSYTHLTLPTKA